MPPNSNLSSRESIIIGRRLMGVGRRAYRDENGERIDGLIGGKLKRVGSYLGIGLFQDPSDHRFWELKDYLGLQGGGPYLLHAIPEATAQSRYVRDSTLSESERYRNRLAKLTPLESDETILSAVGFSHHPPLGVAKRIRWLLDNQLEYVSEHSGHKLYQDPGDGRYWELVAFDYPSMSLGGGLKEISEDPHLLHVVDALTARLKYEL